MIKIKMKRCIALMLSLVTLISAGLGAFPNGFAFAENEDIHVYQDDTASAKEGLMTWLDGLGRNVSLSDSTA